MGGLLEDCIGVVVLEGGTSEDCWRTDGDVDDDTCHDVEGEKGGAAIGNEGERDACDGEEAEVHADVDERLRENECGEANTCETAEWVFGFGGDYEGGADIEEVENDDSG